MAFLNIFRKDEVSETKVLVSGLHSKFEDLINSDAQIYRKFYPSTKVCIFNTGRELTAELQLLRYDVVHLCCDVQADGMLLGDNDDQVSGTEILQCCCDCKVKLLWLASDNSPERYIHGFDARRKPINLVMTIDRNGPKFSDFLDKLLFRLRYGDTLPVAWVNLCPQVPGAPAHAGLPVSIFYAGRGRVVLR